MAEVRLRNRLCSSPVFVLFPLHLTLQIILVVLPFCNKTWPFGKPLLLSRDRRERFLSPERDAGEPGAAGTAGLTAGF